jgi:hypothetical protein
MNELRSPIPGSAHSAPAGGGRRGALVALVALLACGAVVAGIVASSGSDDHDAAAVGPAATTAPGPAVPPAFPSGLPPVTGDPAELKSKVQSVLARTEELDRTVWAKEVEAQQYEEYFIRLWDEFRAAEDKAAVLESAAFEALSFGPPGERAEHDWGVGVTRHADAASAGGQKLDPTEWRSLLGRLQEAGYRATELEFHQSKFEHEPGQPARSVVATVVHLVNETENSRQVVRTKLNVEWAEKAQPDGVFVPRVVEATDLVVASRQGPLGFERVALPGGTDRGLPVSEPASFLLVYDLDGNGFSEILIPAQNVMFRNAGNWQFTVEEIVPGGAEGLEGGVIADFDGDALPDLLCTRADKVYLARGVAGGRFSPGPPDEAVSLAFKAQTVTALTAGDIDGDGDLDAWMGQYKKQYAGGQMPTPYYDANDGFPAALLVNDGTGRFTDQTEAAGLAAKRLRRTFAGSFVDLDGDRDLDLLVNSDFAGLDVYYNDGKGKFTDVTEQVIDERHNFGMSHTFADFNLDGRLDVYTTGMSSTTARRLTAMGAGLEQFPEHQAKRPQMGYGNRMFLAPAATGDAPSAAPARYVQPTYKDDIARTGWSWGSSAADFDNDGDPDLFIGNGLHSGTTCRDYCTKYWRRDIYLGSSREDPVIKSLFAEHGPKGEESWNGFEHDVLFMNEGGRGFVNVSHLFGVAFEFDSRNVITDDFDGDGKVDLLVIEKVVPRGRFMHVLKNTWPTTHNWVGVRLAESGPGTSPMGAEVRVRTAGGGVQVNRVVTGDSFNAQHANARHFGLGPRDAVEAIEVAWPNGEVTVVEAPAVNKWHDVRPDGAATAGR